MSFKDLELTRRLEFWEKWFKTHSEAVCSPVASWREIEISENGFQDFLSDIKDALDMLRKFFDDKS